MSSFPRFAASLLGAIVLAAPPGDQAQTLPAAPAGSFLHRQARSVTQLVQQVQTDPVARRRFARHFHIPEGRVADIFRHTLRAGTLPHPGSYTVFFVAGSGLLYPARMDLHPGTPVFVGKDGRPVLLACTGDPLLPFATAIEVHTIEAVPAAPIAPQEQVVPTTGFDIPIPVTPRP